jgi:hypothetical protein
MNPKQELQVLFIEQKMKDGFPYADIKTMFCDKYSCHPRTFERRVKEAKASIKSDINMAKEMSRLAIADTVVSNNLKLLSDMEIKNLLSKIALGEATHTRHIRIKGKIVGVKETPDFSARKIAIQTLLRMG